MNNRIQINDVAIEVTRRCNMKCKHCLRGDAQKVDFNPGWLDSFFNKVGRINTLTLTGGEPSLVPNILKSIRGKIKKHKVEIGMFYIVTNAKKITKEFLFELMEWYLICDSIEDYDNNIVNYSNDIFHDEAYKKGLRLLKTLRFSGPKEYRSGDPYAGWLIEGRAEKFFEENPGKGSFSNRYTEPDTFSIYDDVVEEGLVYLNCKGNVISSCNWSFKNQDKINSPCFVCSIEDFSIKKLVKFNESMEEELAEAV